MTALYPRCLPARIPNPHSSHDRSIHPAACFPSGESPHLKQFTQPRRFTRSAGLSFLYSSPFLPQYSFQLPQMVLHRRAGSQIDPRGDLLQCGCAAMLVFKLCDVLIDFPFFVCDICSPLFPKCLRDGNTYPLPVEAAKISFSPPEGAIFLHAILLPAPVCNTYIRSHLQ